MSELLRIPNLLRHSMIYDYCFGLNAEESYGRLCQAYGQNVISFGQVQTWFLRFKSDDFSIEIELHSKRAIEEADNPEQPWKQQKFNPHAIEVDNFSKSDNCFIEAFEENKFTEEHDLNEFEIIDELDEEEAMDESIFATTSDVNVNLVEKLEIERVDSENITDEKAPAKRLKLKSVLNEEELEILRTYADMKCEVCSHEFIGWGDMKTHYRKTHGVQGFIRCCNKKLDRIVETKEHTLWHLNPNIFACSVCQKVFSTKENLTGHQKSAHIPVAERRFTCDVCFKKFSTALKLSVHLRKHALDKVEKTIPCLKCPKLKMFKTQKLLSIHMQSCHSNISFMCNFCSKTFKMKGTLETHERSHVEDPIECQICGHFLKNKSRFDHHMTLHKQSETGPYPCAECGKLYKNRRCLQRHTLYIHSTKEYPCSYCEKSFKNKNTCKEHEAIHKGIHLYTCPFCDKTFRSNANMHAHKKKAHPDEYAKLPLPSYLRPPVDR